jgi:hypothetical protein
LSLEAVEVVELVQLEVVEQVVLENHTILLFQGLIQPVL